MDNYCKKHGCMSLKLTWINVFRDVQKLNFQKFNGNYSTVMKGFTEKKIRNSQEKKSLYFI